MKSEISSNRGGARPNAGRKRIASEVCTEPIAMRLPPNLADKLRAKAEARKCSRQQVIIDLLEKME